MIVKMLNNFSGMLAGFFGNFLIGNEMRVDLRKKLLGLISNRTQDINSGDKPHY